jgi:hypothetical protein
MNLDEDKIDDVVLALLQLTAHGDGLASRAWKSQSWEVMDRLHQKGFISARAPGLNTSTILATGGFTISFRWAKPNPARLFSG